MERRFPDAVRRDLARRGHPVDTVGDLDGPCSIEIIRRDGATGMLLGRFRPAARWLGIGVVKQAGPCASRDPCCRLPNG